MKKLCSVGSLLAVVAAVSLLSLHGAEAAPKGAAPKRPENGSSIAKSQPVVATPAPLRVPLKPLRNIPRNWTTVHAYERGVRDAMDIAATGAFNGVPALGGFRVHFENGDHKLRRVGVAPKGALAQFSFSDQNGDDPYAATATWALLGAGTSGVVHASGSGRFEIPLGSVKAGHTLVLSGFEFQRKGGTDANVRTIGIWLDSQKATARVSLIDDQGADFRGFERTLGMAFLSSLVPLGDLAAQTSTMSGAMHRLQDGALRPYAVSVYYAWIPNELVEGTDSFTGTSRMPSSGRQFPGNGVIQGFEFYFGNSDHHLLDFGVLGKLMNPPPPAMQTPSGEAVAFQDNNRDDPLTWAVRMVRLTPRP